MDNWNWCYYRLFSQFSDAMYTCDTVVGAGPGCHGVPSVSMSGRTGRIRSSSSLRHSPIGSSSGPKAISSKAMVEQPDAVDPEKVRVRLARLWGVDPAKIRFRGEPSAFMEPDTIFMRGMDLKPAVSSNQPRENSDHTSRS